MTAAPAIEPWQQQDAYLSWLACIEEFRRRHLAGEPLPEMFRREPEKPE